MKTRMNTKYGMVTVSPNNDPEFLTLTFDTPVALNNRLKTKEWIVSKDKFEKEIKL
jgi:hypothetical protein